AFDDGFPSQAVGHLIEHIDNQNARPSKSRLAVADLWVNNNKTPYGFGHVFHSSLDGRFHSRSVRRYYTGREAAAQTNPSSVRIRMRDLPVVECSHLVVVIPAFGRCQCGVDRS